MKAVQIPRTGGPEVLIYTDVQDPSPGPGQALVDVKAIGVNYAEVQARVGLVPSTLPAIPGSEAAGVVTQGSERGSPRSQQETWWLTRGLAHRMRSK